MSLPVPVTQRSVVRAGMSPVALAAAGGGLVVALLTGTTLGWLVSLVLLTWAVGAGATLALQRASVAAGRSERIDPFGVGEPWRHFVRDALTSRNRFDEALRDARPGPLRDRLSDIRRSVDSGVQEVWQVAKQAQNVSQARQRLDAPTLRRRLETLEEKDNEPAAAAVRSQLGSAERLDAVIADTTARLETLEARLTEAVARAIEVSALAGQDDDLVGLGSTVDQVVNELESLRAALAETSGSGHPD
ncbi:MAG: hypothetical protein JJE52_14055 [Acidimicrobiia bacterium]|nr:hypothetical protein [Acidimicrobiia bacterium]